jgi:hypothetical protein
LTFNGVLANERGLKTPYHGSGFDVENPVKTLSLGREYKDFGDGKFVGHDEERGCANKI